MVNKAADDDLKIVLLVTQPLPGKSFMSVDDARNNDVGTKRLRLTSATAQFARFAVVYTL